MSYLERLKNQKRPSAELTKLTKLQNGNESTPFVSFGSSSVEAFQKTGFHGFTLADLQKAAHPDEWPDIKDNPAALECFALALLEGRQIQAGVKPERFTQPMYCPGCGVVPMPPTWPTTGEYAPLGIPRVNSCRWCDNRLEGRRYPKLYPVKPDHWNERENGAWPYSPERRPVIWQGEIHEAAEECRN